MWTSVSGAAATAIHVHGTWGNFYANPFIVPLGNLYSEHGISYLSANFPGHDETAVVERFDESMVAMDEWIDELAPSGPLILQGHSLGALKVLGYMQCGPLRNTARVRGLVLLSPFDVVAFYALGKPENIPARLERASTLLQSAGASALVPKEMFNLWDISVGTYLDLASPGCRADQFPTRSSLESAWIKSSQVPIFVSIGSEDFAAYPSPTTVVEASSKLTAVTARLVPNAPHNFAGETEVLVSEVARWLSSHNLLDKPT